MVLRLKPRESRTPPGLPRTENHQETRQHNSRSPARETVRGFCFSHAKPSLSPLVTEAEMTRWVIAVVFWILASGAVQAQTFSDFAGTWAVRVADKNLFVLVLQPNGDSLDGYIDDPVKMSLSKAKFFVSDPHVGRQKVIGAEVGAGGVLTLTLQATSAANTNHFVMKLDGSNAILAHGANSSDFNVAPLPLIRVEQNAQVSTDWDINVVYNLDGSNMPNAEMKAIFSEDQRVRTGGADPATWGKTDALRRDRTRQLLAQGALRNGKDFEEASYIFQHGDTPDDYLLAHTLACVAIAKGDSAAIWISAATLDRYLMAIGQSQIYGTQYGKRGADGQLTENAPWTQEPYNRGLVSDALRAALNVPPQAQQQKQLDDMKAGKSVP
jgi:hypothetical protein